VNGFVGTAALTRLALRRDRVVLPLWILSLAGFTLAITEMSVNGLQRQADVVQETRFMATTPAMRLLGLATGATVGGYTMIRGYVTIAVLAALMSILAVVRHTRQGEETGRSELVGAGVVGRHAPLAAGLSVVVAANAILAVLMGLAMLAAGQPAAGSFAAGAAVAAVGLSFAGVAAVTTQLAASTRGASGLAGAVLGVAFLASGVGNMAGSVDATGLRVRSAWPAWLSPIGWGQQMRPFGGERWWPLALAIALLLLCAAVAVRLAASRDIGQGLLAQRPGHATAGRDLRSPFGLALRLQRGALIGWGVAMLGFGAVMGAVIGQVTTLTGSARDWYARMGGSDRMVDAYRASIIAMAGMAVAVYAVQVLLRMRTDEVGGSLEPVLATGVGRARWVGAHAAGAAVGSVVLMLLFAVGMGLSAGAVLGGPASQVATLVGAALVQLPAIAVVGALTVAAAALLPRAAAGLSWGVLLLAILFGPMFGPTLGLPGWVQDASPFTSVPKVPAAAMSAGGLLLLTTVAAGVGLVGVVAVRRRSLALPA
jgi:ABC-2 type transport system permease protein